MLAASLLAAGCTSPEPICHETATPAETLDRICAGPAPQTNPVAVQPGNVWPAAASPVPTLLDIERQIPRNHPYGKSLCRGRQRAVGVALGLCYMPASNSK
jgi:hypothetical protein